MVRSTLHVQPCAQGPDAPHSVGGRRGRMEETSSVLGHWLCLRGISAWSSLPWPSCSSPNGLQTPCPPVCCPAAVTQLFNLFCEMSLVFFSLSPMTAPGAELQAWPVPARLERTQGLCRALGHRWPLCLEPDNLCGGRDTPASKHGQRMGIPECSPVVHQHILYS